MTEQQRNTILSRWREGASLRQIARELHLSRHTVRRVVTGVEAQRAGLSAPRPRRAHGLDAYETVMHELLARYPDVTGVRLFEELRQRGYPGSYSTVRLRLRELRPRTAPRPVVRFETGPGRQAQMDYATYDLDFSEEGRRRVYAFSYVLAYSRRQYLRFVEAQDLETTLRQHVRAFDYFGGVAVTCLYDNMKVVVQGYEDDVPLYNQRFLAFATHYGFRPQACRPYRPQTKGKVERPFAYVETNLLNGRTFRTLAHLNEFTPTWLATVADVRVHGRTKQTPLALYALELPHLIPLPAQPYDVSPVCYRVVNVEGDIVYRQNRYSVPWQYIGRTLPVRVTETAVIVYDPQVREIARHPVFPRLVTGQCRHLPAHRPAEDVPQRQAQLQARFAELGEAAARFLDALLRTQRYGKDQAQRVLALLATYHRADVQAALERAVRYGAFSYAAVERILAVQAQPKSVLETLAEEQRPHLAALLGDTAVSARPLTDYRSLFGEEIPHATPSHPSDPAQPAGEPGPAAADAGGEPA
jgi:transposase